MNDANGTNAADAAPAEHALAYHVLMNSRRYGTNAFACADLNHAAQTLAWLAQHAEVQRQVDGAQRFFCLLPPTTTPEESAAPTLRGPDTPENEEAIVVCLAEGALQWIAAAGLYERPLIVLEAIGSEAEGPFVCWQACARPLRNLSHTHRHAVNRYLHLRRLRLRDELDNVQTHDRREAEEGSGLVDPVVYAWQQSHPERNLLLTLAAGEEAQDAFVEEVQSGAGQHRVVAVRKEVRE